MQNTAKILDFRRHHFPKPQLPRDKVADEIRCMLKSDPIPPRGTPERAAVVKERRAYYKQLLSSDNPPLTHNDWMIIFANTLPE